tara:strand:+ start:590 stop:1867 length:1278 start_codon:yes stop_codon:yes gene_type:complete
MLRNKNRFVKGKSINGHPYDEPTYTSFFLMFDYINSPLFNGTAAKFMEDVLGEKEKAEKLKKFTKYLKRFNKEMPWMWKSITGVNAAHQYGKLPDPYPYAESNILELECGETLDYTVAGMFYLLKDAVLDTGRMVQLLPTNLQYFSLWVHVQEIRNFVPFIGAESAMDFLNKTKGMNVKERFETLTGVNDFGEEEALNLVQDRLDADVLDWKSMGMGPRFVTKFEKCKFNWDSASDFFSEVRSDEIGEDVKHKIKIEFHVSSLQEDTHYLTHYASTEADSFSVLDDDLTSQLKAAGNKILDAAGNQVFEKAKGAIAGKIDDIKSQLLLGNVYGANLLSSAQDALNAGSINAILPMLKKEDPREITNTGESIGSTIYPPSAPEVNLENTKIYEGTLPETPLQGTNIYPPRRSEQDSDNLGNALNDG